jgi:DHA1 family inner membrane transport protein
MLCASLSVMFTRYAIATMLTSFFATVCTYHGISAAVNGLVMSAYPVGVTVGSLGSARFITRFGTRSCVAVGLSLTGLFMMLFGLVPDILGSTASPTALAIGFGLAYGLSGLTGAVSETACIALCGRNFPDRVGSVMVAVGNACGLGCMLGPPIGGWLYAYGNASPAWRFRLPFVVVLVLALLMAAAAALVLPADRTVEAKASSGLSDITAVMTPNVVLTVVALALNGGIVASLDPTLAYRLGAAPFGFNSAEVGLFFMYSSVSYILVSMLLGPLIDRVSTKPSALKLIQAGAFFVLFISFALMGPLLFLPHSVKVMFNTRVPAMVSAMVLKGIGSAGNTAAYPDLVADAPDTPEASAALSSLYNGGYAFGWAGGELLGGVVFSVFHDAAKWSVGTLKMPVSLLTGNAAGFDMYATSMAMTSLVYGCVLCFGALDYEARLRRRLIPGDGNQEETHAYARI